MAIREVGSVFAKVIAITYTLVAYIQRKKGRLDIGDRLAVPATRSDK